MNEGFHRIAIREIFDGYINGDKVLGYGERLNIKPPYQREFIYNKNRQIAVVQSIIDGLPIGIITWSKNGDSYDLVDGQQRILSICNYLSNHFSINSRYFMNLTGDEKEQILNYELVVYIFEGTDREKIDWFYALNMNRYQLTEQEKLNALYQGPWVEDAKLRFSNEDSIIHQEFEPYMNGRVLRQDYLATALRWIANRDGITIEKYMAKNQFEENADELYDYFMSVMNWVQDVFVDYRIEMKGLEWGIMYNKYHKNSYDPSEISILTSELMQDNEVRKKAGIYEYLLSRDEKFLNLRNFTRKIKREVYERQEGVCANCKRNLSFEEAEADHIKPWSKGGRSTIDNCQILCSKCNRLKADVF